MTLLVRDEADIIGDVLEFHLKSGVDLILALDNHSEDGTTDILREFERTRRLEYLYEPSEDYLQDVWTSSLAQRAFVEHHADWIINGDADEFFIPQGGTLKDVLRRVPPGIGAVSVQRHDMMPIARPMRSSPPFEMVYRKRISLEWVKGHPIVDKLIHRGFPDVKVGRGSHVIESRYFSQTAPCPDILTFHFPIRSLAQFTRKVRHVGFGRMKNNVMGSRYDYWYSALTEGKLEPVFLEYQIGPAQLEQKLASGEVIEDRRLADLLGAIKSQPPE
jgi:hypothetical protein